MGKLSSQARAEDVDQRRLAEELKGATMDCVNAVGVDLNTASPAILERLRSGLGIFGVSSSGFQVEASVRVPCTSFGTHLQGYSPMLPLDAVERAN